MKDDLISRQAAIDELDKGAWGVEWDKTLAKTMIESLPSAQQERIIYGNMSDEEFEKWLYGHGICSPNIRESIPCDAVPLLIDNAISELPSARPELAQDLPNACTDAISRQAAIDMLKNRWKKTRNYEGIGDDIAEECELYLKQVPSAQPEVKEIGYERSTGDRSEGGRDMIGFIVGLFIGAILGIGIMAIMEVSGRGGNNYE